MLVELLFFGVPIATIVFLIYCFSHYSSLKDQEAKEPGSVEPEKLRFWKKMRWVALTIVGVLVACIVALIVMLFFAIAYM